MALRWGQELGLLALLYLGYVFGRSAMSVQVGDAHRRGWQILHLEEVLRLDIERELNALAVGIPAVGISFAYLYATLHYLVTPAVMVWIAARRRDGYRRARTSLLAATALGLVCYWLLPTAPPRLLDAGFTDVMATFSSVGWWGEAASAPRGLEGFSNQFAAFPSLHVGWAMWVALAVRDNVRRRDVQTLGVGLSDPDGHRGHGDREPLSDRCARRRCLRLARPPFRRSLESRPSPKLTLIAETDQGHWPPEGSHGPQPATGLLQPWWLGAMSSFLPLTRLTATRHEPESVPGGAGDPQAPPEVEDDAHAPLAAPDLVEHRRPALGATARRLVPPWLQPPPRRNSWTFLSNFPPAFCGLRSSSSKWPSGVESPLRSNQTVSR